MQYNKGPSVISTYPKNYDINIPLDVEVTIEFDIDISKTSIAGSVNMFSRLGEKIDCRISYNDKKIVVTPRAQLSGDNSYRIVISGDNDPNNPNSAKGITNPLGIPMLGDYIFSFTTFSGKLAVEDVINGTPNNVVLTEQPVLKASVTDNNSNLIGMVDIDVSDSNTFSDVLWRGSVSLEDLVKGIKPDYFFKDGSYYWRARAVGQIEGDWSETFQFGIETKGEATVVGDDESELDAAFPDSWDMLEANIIEVYPENNFSNVATNLKTINIVLDKIVPSEVLNTCTLTLTGYPVDEDDSRESHGEVECELNVSYDHNLGTTTIILSLPELGGD